MHHGVKSYRNTKFPLRLVIDRDLFLCVLVLGFFCLFSFNLNKLKECGWKEKLSKWLYQIGLATNLGAIFLTNVWCWCARLIVSSTSPGQVDIDSTKKAGWANNHGWKLHFNIFALVPASRFLSWIPFMIDCELLDEVSLFLPKLLLVGASSPQTENNLTQSICNFVISNLPKKQFSKYPIVYVHFNQHNVILFQCSEIFSLFMESIAALWLGSFLRHPQTCHCWFQLLNWFRTENWIMSAILLSDKYRVFQ